MAEFLIADAAAVEDEVEEDVSSGKSAPASEWHRRMSRSRGKPFWYAPMLTCKTRTFQGAKCQ